jgi:tetratricopeptide (TPR) repeat protein
MNASPELFTAVRNRARMVKDLEYARRHMPQNALICKALHDDRVQNGNHFEACKLAVSYFGCAGDPKADDYGLDLDYLGTLTIEKFTEIVEDFKGLLPSERYGLSRDGGIFDAVVQRLHKDNKYSAVAELAEIAGDYYSEKTGVLFEIAYAFAEARKRGKARRYYNLYLQKYSNATAALNNLAILEEHDGRLEQAETMLRRCIELDPEDELPRNNLKRVLRLKDVVEKFQKDDLATRKLVIELWRKKGPGYEFECTPADVQGILPSTSAEEAKARLRQVAERGYLEQKDERNRFQLSAGLRSQMSDLERTIDKEGEIAKLAGEISKENLEKIGFDEDLFNSLAKIGNPQLQSLLNRDLKEAALARLTNSHKTALVMCGSIIEAVLTDKICGKSIRKYKLENGKSVNVSRMDLGDLLFVAMKESLIDDQLYHLAHALRGFRNLIHPGVEQRKKAISASESNARIAWDITRKLLLEM